MRWYGNLQIVANNNNMAMSIHKKREMLTLIAIFWYRYSKLNRFYLILFSCFFLYFTSGTKVLFYLYIRQHRTRGIKMILWILTLFCHIILLVNEELFSKKSCRFWPFIVSLSLPHHSPSWPSDTIRRLGTTLPRPSLKNARSPDLFALYLFRKHSHRGAFWLTNTNFRGTV